MKKSGKRIISPKTLALVRGVMLGADPGIAAAEGAKALGASVHTFMDYLRHLKRLGELDQCRIYGNAVIWGPTAKIAAVRDEQRRVSRALLLARRSREGKARRWRAYLQSLPALVEEGDSNPFTHRLLSASECSAIGKVGPCSIWDLASTYADASSAK